MSHRIHEPNHAGECILCGKFVGKDMNKPAKSVANYQKEPAICVANDPVLFNGKDIRTVYPISTFSGTTQDELVELIRQVQIEVQDGDDR